MKLKEIIKYYYNSLSWRPKFILIGGVTIIALFSFYSIGILLMHPIFLDHIKQSRDLLNQYNQNIVKEETFYEGKNLQTAVKVVEYKNIDINLIIQQFEKANFSFIERENNKLEYLDNVHKVRIVIQEENNSFIIKFSYP